jgi:hypothetical protein
MATGSETGICCLCPKLERVPGPYHYDHPAWRGLGFCERHYRPIRRYLARLSEREAKRRRGGILTAEDFLRRDPDER